MLLYIPLLTQNNQNQLGSFYIILLSDRQTDNTEKQNLPEGGNGEAFL